MAHTDRTLIVGTIVDEEEDDWSNRTDSLVNSLEACSTNMLNDLMSWQLLIG